MLGKSGIAFLFILSCSCLAIRNEGQSHANLTQREDEYNRAMLFIADPIKNFEKIKDIKNPFVYISIAEDNSKEGIFEPFLKHHFSEADDKRANILIYLIMLKPTGEIGYLLVDQIVELFISCPKPFLDVLRKRADWANFVESMKAGSWIGFVSAVRRLTDSGFEGTFKRYVLR